MSYKDFPKHQEVNKHMQEKLSLPKAGEIGGCSNRSRHCPLGRLLERFVFIFNCSYVCVCLCVAVFMCFAVATDARRGCRDSGAGVTSGCQQPDMGARNWTLPCATAVCTLNLWGPERVFVEHRQTALQGSQRKITSGVSLWLSQFTYGRGTTASYNSYVEFHVNTGQDYFLLPRQSSLLLVLFLIVLSLLLSGWI